MFTAIENIIINTPAKIFGGLSSHFSAKMNIHVSTKCSHVDLIQPHAVETIIEVILTFPWATGKCKKTRCAALKENQRPRTIEVSGECDKTSKWQ